MLFAWAWYIIAKDKQFVALYQYPLRFYIKRPKMKNRYKKKNNNYEPLTSLLDKNTTYNEILTWTLSKQVVWHIVSKEKDYVCYVLQGENRKIIFKHYPAKPSHSQYEFVHFSGHYTYQECKALEDAIRGVGLKKTVSPSKHKTKQKKEHEKEPAKKTAEPDGNMIYWKEFKEATFTGKCNWEYEYVNDNSRLFGTVINNTNVTFKIKIDNKTKRPAYRILSSVLKGSISLENKEGAAFERFLLNHCTHSISVERNKDCLYKTCAEYHVFKQEQARLKEQASKEKRNQKIKEKRKSLYSELYGLLLKKYKMPYGGVKIGMAVLAEDRSGQLLQTVCRHPIPSSVAGFSVSMARILESIDPRCDTTPVLLNFYSYILNIYIEKCAQSSSNIVTFNQETIIKYTRRIRELQKDLIPERNNPAASDNESAPHSDGIKTKEIKKHKRVNAHDFIIRRSVLSCMYKYHSVINVDAVITVVDRNRDFAELTVPAGYCQQCQKFFILESDYAQIATHGEPLCTVLDEKRYCENYKNERYFSEISAWPEKSILGKCGYSVRQATGLSTLERRKILANVIDREILSKIEIRSHLKKQIALHARHPIAVDKWESDEDFVAAYNKPELFTRVDSIRNLPLGV